MRYNIFQLNLGILLVSKGSLKDQKLVYNANCLLKQTRNISALGVLNDMYNSFSSSIVIPSPLRRAYCTVESKLPQDSQEHAVENSLTPYTCTMTHVIYMPIIFMLFYNKKSCCSM